MTRVHSSGSCASSPSRFPGTARAALDFYQSVFGGMLTDRFEVTRVLDVYQAN